MRPQELLRLPAAALLSLTSLAGCEFAPPLRVPVVPTAAHYTAAPAPRDIGSSVNREVPPQHIIFGTSLARPWWHAFHSPQLDGLINRALTHSPTVAAAEAQLRAARANVAIAAAVLYPQLGMNLGASRTKTSGANFGGHLPGSTFSLYTGQVAVSYYPDFFGVNRLLYRGSTAQLNAQRAALQAARLTLAGNVLDAAVGIAATSAEISATSRLIAAQRQLLELVQAQYRGGATTYGAVVAQRAQIEASEAELPPLQQQRSVYRHLLAVLLGTAPSRLRDRSFTLQAFSLPPRVPLALPSTLLRNRPDIRIAEEQMRYALTGVGIAKAQFYPLVTLSASAGSSALTAGKLFDASSTVWSLGGALAQPIFEGGKLRAQERGAYATYAATRAAYRSTVLTAFQQVADALRALQHDAAAAQAQARLLDTLREQLRLAEAGWRAGATDFSAVLIAEADYRTALPARARITAARLQDTAALFVALGGDPWPQHTEAAPAVAAAP
jgi:NodT family efflux transporter outer membrane factor (OMF) lipoprotein